MSENGSLAAAILFSLALFVFLFAFVGGVSLALGFAITKGLAAAGVFSYSAAVVLGVSALVFLVWMLLS